MTASDFSQSFTDYLKLAVSPYHAVKQIIAIAENSGFELIKDEDLMNRSICLKLGGKYIVHRNCSSVCGFVVPDTFDPTTSGFTICAGHTDSPCLRVRPESNMSTEGMIQLGCETYGGGLWHTWFDRELSVAGRLLIRTENGIEEKLINIIDPICLIPNLAIHLQSADERAAFKVDKEEHLRPVLQKILSGQDSPISLDIIARHAGVDAKTVIDCDLSLYDATPPRLWGSNKEFVASGRLDNQLSNFAIFSALAKIDSSAIQDISMAVAFDHEEVGSTSWIGADSDLLPGWLEAINDRIPVTKPLSTRPLPVGDIVLAPNCFQHSLVIRNSLLVSIDGAHGVHPNYSSKHQAQHKVMLGDGVVIKTNENQRYTTNGLTRAIAKIVCGEEVKIQDFVVKNSSPCGSTIGPALASRLSMKALDAGAPQWAMHSIRESCHVEDVKDLCKFAGAFYNNYRSVANATKHL